MKTFKQLIWLTPLAFLVGCALPVQSDYTIAEWQENGFLPPTGGSNSRVYSQPQPYPATTPVIIVQSSGDQGLADSIRQGFEYDRGLAPSLHRVTVKVQNGQVILLGSVRSDLDQRVIVDNIREMAGVTRITDNLEIDPYMN
jgi:hypothetical protein